MQRTKTGFTARSAQASWLYWLIRLANNCVPLFTLYIVPYCSIECTLKNSKFVLINFILLLFVLVFLFFTFFNCSSIIEVFIIILVGVSFNGASTFMSHLLTTGRL